LAISSETSSFARRMSSPEFIGRAFQRRAHDDHRVVNLGLRNIVVGSQRSRSVHRLPARLVCPERLRGRILGIQCLLARLVCVRIGWFIAGVAQRRRIRARLLEQSNH
jgi:hypothetical protein